MQPLQTFFFLKKANQIDTLNQSYSFQAISIAIQKGNVQCIQNTYGESAFEDLDEVHYTSQNNSS